MRAPSVGALDEAAEAGFTNYRQSGQMYPGDEYRSLLQNTQDQLRQAGFHNVPESAPVPHAVLDRELQRVQRAPFVTSQDLDALRTQLRGQGLRGQNVPANMQAREALFGYIDQNLPPGGRSVRDAVGNYRQARHSEALTDKDAATSRLNLAKAQGPELSAEQTRTNIAKLLNSKTGLRGFSDAEKAVMQGANTPSTTQRAAQNVGNALQFRGGDAITTAAKAALWPVGAAARSYANRGARQEAGVVDDFIRGQSPLAREAFATAPSNFSASVPGPYRATANPAIAAAVAARLRERQPAAPNIPMQYRVLPDGTIEEFL